MNHSYEILRELPHDDSANHYQYLGFSGENIVIVLSDWTEVGGGGFFFSAWRDKWRWMGHG